MILTVAVVALLAVVGVTAWVVHLTARDARTRDRAWEKKEYAWSQERQQLLDRIMYLSDRPWMGPETTTEDEPLPDPYDEPYDPTMIPLETADSIIYPAGVV